MSISHLQWKIFANEAPLVTSPSPKFPIEVSPKCLVKTDHPSATLVIAVYVKPKAENENPFWHDDNGNVIEWNVLAWADLTETEQLFDSLFAQVEDKKNIALTQAQKDQITQDFTARCDDLIANRMQLIGDKEDIKYNNLPDWRNHRDIQKAYFNNTLTPDDKKFMDKLLAKTYKKYNDQAKTGFGRIKLIGQ